MEQLMCFNSAKADTGSMPRKFFTKSSTDIKLIKSLNDLKGKSLAYQSLKTQELLKRIADDKNNVLGILNNQFELIEHWNQSHTFLSSFFEEKFKSHTEYLMDEMTDIYCFLLESFNHYPVYESSVIKTKKCFIQFRNQSMEYHSNIIQLAKTLVHLIEILIERLDKYSVLKDYD